MAAVRLTSDACALMRKTLKNRIQNLSEATRDFLQDAREWSRPVRVVGQAIAVKFLFDIVSARQIDSVDFETDYHGDIVKERQSGRTAALAYDQRGTMCWRGLVILEAMWLRDGQTQRGPTTLRVAGPAVRL